MEGKRFVAGLFGGLLVALALVTASGGFGATPLTVFNAALPQSAATSTTTVSSTTTIPYSTSTTTQMTVSMTSLSTTGGYPVASLNSSATGLTSTSTTTFGTETSTTSVSTSNPAGQTAANNANGGTYFLGLPSGTGNPTRLASIPHQPITSNVEIIAPVLAAFLLGAFLYQVAFRERRKVAGEDLD